MTWRRWTLVLQALFACFTLFLILRMELGFYTPPPGGKFDMAVVNRWFGGFAIYSLFAAIGILARKAWGYFMEIPLIPLIFLFAFVFPSRVKEDATFPWINEVVAVTYMIFAVSEMWKCAKTGFSLLRKGSNPPQIAAETYL